MLDSPHGSGPFSPEIARAKNGAKNVKTLVFCWMFCFWMVKKVESWDGQQGEVEV